jgi:hypothetical protein
LCKQKQSRKQNKQQKKKGRKKNSPEPKQNEKEQPQTLMNPPSAFAPAPAQPTFPRDEFGELKTALLLPVHAGEAAFSFGKQAARNHLIAMAADGVQAFAKLQGESFVYYVQSLSLTLGRAVAGREPVDVDLGPSRSISRVHARIDYDFQLRQFVITPLGKNGIVIDGFPYSKNHTAIPLKSK